MLFKRRFSILGIVWDQPSVCARMRSHELRAGWSAYVCVQCTVAATAAASAAVAAAGRSRIFTSTR